jgi:hypothetical protein
MVHTHDVDAWRAALAMVQHYGPYALQRANAHLDDLRHAGDAVGVAVWAMIAAAIRDLTRDRQENEPLN